ncbi:MAG TPA: hypothetical protein PKD55_20640, partial [Bellilinea sp.]|nr:hypothetical protein [Bellilinea sp.]
MSSTKRNFMRLVKQTPICIATTGLVGSIGYKFTEYIAAARAIVSEANVNQVYGPFGVEQNYLVFNSVEQCVHSVQRLFDDHELRLQMMRNNLAYYHTYIRPDMCALNSLHDALANAEARL